MLLTIDIKDDVLVERGIATQSVIHFAARFNVDIEKLKQTKAQNKDWLSELQGELLDLMDSSSGIIDPFFRES